MDLIKLLNHCMVDDITEKQAMKIKKYFPATFKTAVSPPVTYRDGTTSGWHIKQAEKDILELI